MSRRRTDFTDEVFETVKSTNLSATVRSGIGDPIRLSDFHPVKCETLVRVGSSNDGGYVVPLEAIKAAHALVSFGLAHNWTFERDFKKYNEDAIIHCYDHTVSLRTALQFSIGQLLQFVFLFRARSLRKIFTWIDYKLFFHSDGTHFKQRIGPDNQDNSATIDDVFSRPPAGCPVFVKMDIEGSEYLVLDDLLRHSQNITAMAIEFHDVDTHPDLFGSFVEKIKRGLLYRTYSRQQHGRHRALQFPQCSGNYIPAQAVFRFRSITVVFEISDPWT